MPLPTMGKHPHDLSQNDQELADACKLHVDVDGSGNGVDATDDDDLQECLKRNSFTTVSNATFCYQFLGTACL